MPSDPALYALALENNRMLKALTERMAPNPDTTTPEDAAQAMGEAVASRLNAMLCPDASQRTEAPLEDALREVERRLKGIPAGSAIALIQSSIRDAALEEAAHVLGDIPLTPLPEVMRVVREGRERIRALKSKPAPVDLRLSANDDEEILASGGGFSHVSGKTTQAKPAPQPSKNPGEFDRVVVAVDFGSGPSRTVVAEPVHDSGWALAQMRAGKKVVVPEWWAGKRRILWARIVNPNSRDERILDNLGELIHLTQDVYLSDKWQVVDA